MSAFSSRLLFVDAIHTQFINFARKCVSAPAKKDRGIPAAPPGMLKSGLDHDLFKLWQGRPKNCLFSSFQFLVGPVFKPLLPGYSRGLSFNLV